MLARVFTSQLTISHAPQSTTITFPFVHIGIWTRAAKCESRCSVRSAIDQTPAMPTTSSIARTSKPEPRQSWCIAVGGAGACIIGSHGAHLAHSHRLQCSSQFVLHQYSHLCLCALRCSLRGSQPAANVKPWVLSTLSSEC